MSEQINKWFRDSAAVQLQTVQSQAVNIQSAARMIVEAFNKGNKLLIFGNGGSAADSQHVAAEFINRFKIERPPLPAVALTTDSSVLTSVGNDYSFDDIFLKQIKALAASGDVVWAISTSGGSANVVSAAREAARRGASTIGLTGRDGGRLALEVDCPIIVPTQETPMIQETHLIIEHVICELVDTMLFGPQGGEGE